MIKVSKVDSAPKREQALKVIEQVYFKEKNWISSIEGEIPPDIALSAKYSWFLATVDDNPAGVLRLYYDPPFHFPPEYNFTFRSGVDINQMAKSGRFVEIGRFMILPEYRKKVLVAIRLMGIAVREVVCRNYTHFITDVFEGEPHSPLEFHTRVLGFEIIGSHMYGELNCSLTRIILTLDILKSFKRLKERRNRLYRTFTEGIQSFMEAKIARIQ